MSRSAPYSTTNLNRNKSQSQPAVKRTPNSDWSDFRILKFPNFLISESVRSFVWKNPLKRNGRGKVRNPHIEEKLPSKISTGLHKRTKSSEFLDQDVKEEERRFSDDEEETEAEAKIMNEVEMDDGEEDWEKEMEQIMQEKVKSNPKRAKRRMSGGNLLDTEPSEQVDVEMDQIYNSFPQKCQVEPSKAKAQTSNLLLSHQNDLSKSVDFESHGGFKGHHQTSFLI